MAEVLGYRAGQYVRWPCAGCGTWHRYRSGARPGATIDLPGRYGCPPARILVSARLWDPAWASWNRRLTPDYAHAEVRYAA